MMSKVLGFLGFSAMVLAAILLGAFVVRSFVPVGWRGLFSFQGA